MLTLLALALAFFTHPLGMVALLAALGLVGIATVYPGALTGDAIQKLGGSAFVPLAASGAIDPHTPNRYIITKAGIAALTLAAPTPGADDGLVMRIISATAFAHTVTTVGLLVDGAGHVNTATFPAAGGGCLDLVAYQGKWYVLNNQNIAFA